MTTSTLPRGVAVRLELVSKTFPGQMALRDVDLDVRYGEVHALVGENGSGKSTLIKCLAGYHAPDAKSRIHFGTWDEGEPAVHAPKGHRERSISFVHQDMGIVPSMTVAENVALGCGYETRGGVHIDWKALERLAGRALSRLGRSDIQVRALASSLSLADQAIVALARAFESLGGRPGVIVMDEPTAALTERDVSALFDTVRELVRHGVGILFVSHRFVEVFDVADRVTVLRDGRSQGTFGIEELDERRLARLMLGEAVSEVDPPSEHSAGGQPVLAAAGLVGRRVDHLSLEVRQGEILGIAGLLGSGRSELLRILAGAQRSHGGSITLAGSPASLSSPAEALRAGIAYVPPDRLGSALFPDMTVAENLTVCTIKRYGLFKLRLRQEVDQVEELMARYNVKPRARNRLAGQLSGGNQQKVILARAIETRPQLLLLDEPTSGVDIGAKAEIHNIVKTLASEQGVAVIVVSSELPELVALCHRVIVLRDGAHVAELRPPTLSVDAIVDRAYAEGAST